MAFKDRVKERVAAREEKADRGKGQPIPWTPFPNGFPGAGNKKTSEPSKAEKDKALMDSAGDDLDDDMDINRLPVYLGYDQDDDAKTRTLAIRKGQPVGNKSTNGGTTYREAPDETRNGKEFDDIKNRDPHEEDLEMEDDGSSSEEDEEGESSPKFDPTKASSWSGAGKYSYSYEPGEGKFGTITWTDEDGKVKRETDKGAIAAIMKERMLQLGDPGSEGDGWKGGGSTEKKAPIGQGGSKAKAEAAYNEALAEKKATEVQGLARKPSIEGVGMLEDAESSQDGVMLEDIPEEEPQKNYVEDLFNSSESARWDAERGAAGVEGPKETLSTMVRGPDTKEPDFRTSSDEDRVARNKEFETTMSYLFPTKGVKAAAGVFGEGDREEGRDDIGNRFYDAVGSLFE